MAVGREIWCNGQNHPLGHFTKSRPIETSLPCAGDMDANMGLPSLMLMVLSFGHCGLRERERERERDIIPILKIRKVEAKERWHRERTQGLEAGRLN